MTHKELVQLGAKWLKWHKDNIHIPNCKIIAKELVAATGTGENPDILGFSYYASVNIEVKVSRADFLRDQKKRHKTIGVGMGNMKLYLCPEGLIKVDELPDGWGLLYCSEAGKISIAKLPEKRDADLDSERTMLMSIIRRMNAPTKWVKLQ